MKPTRNRVYCNAIHRTKMLFESQEKADNFIRFNAGEMAEDDENEYVPIRSYYCHSCGGWHVTHHPETRKQQRLDSIQETAYQLERFVSRLKTSYANRDWRTWSSQMDEAYTWVEKLERLPSFHNFLIEIKRQLKHYKSMMDNAAGREQKQNRKLSNQLGSVRKQLFDEIRTFMSDLDVVGVRDSGRKLCELMESPGYAFFEEHIKADCESLSVCFRNDFLYDTLVDMTCTIMHLKVHHPYMLSDELQHIINRLNGQLERLRSADVHPFILHPYTDTVLKYARILHKRGTDIDKTGEVVDKATLTLNRFYETARRYLVDCINALMSGNRTTALMSLTAADERIKTIPISKEKVELMNMFVQVARQGGFFQEQGGDMVPFPTSVA